MHVLLDTNIYLEDITFSRPDMGALRSYLQKSNSFLLIPEVVDREVKKYVAVEARKSHDQLKSNLASRLSLVDKALTREFLTEKLQANFDDFISRMPRKSLDFSDITTEQLIQRSLEERAPFLKSDKGMRDTIIWLSALKELQTLKPGEKIVLISRNSSDFGTDNQLKQSLQDELKDIGREDGVVFFNSLSDFLEAYEKPIAYIDDEFIENVIDPYMSHYADYDESDLDIDPERRGSLDHTIDSVDYDGYEIERYYVYEETDEEYTIYVEATANYVVGITYSETEYEYEDGWPVPSEHREKEYESAFRTAEFFIKVDKATNQVTGVEDA